MSRPVGRPSRLPIVRDRLLQALRQGNHRSTAARYAGLGDSTFHRWMTDARPEFREFRTLVEQAEAEAEVAVVANLVEASRRDYRAALAWLERRAPNRWRPDMTIESPEEVLAPAIASPSPSPPGEDPFGWPEAIRKPFFNAWTEFDRTGVIPEWVGDGQRLADEWVAGFRETAD